MRRLVCLGMLLAIGCKRTPAPSIEGDTPTSTSAPLPKSPARSSPARSATPSATEPARAVADPEPASKKPGALLDRPPATWAVTNAAWIGPIDPEADRPWLERLAAAPVANIARNKGGATITLEFRFDDAKRAVFKPEQRHSASNFRAEIAAYHLDRVLGFGRTAPVVGRSVSAARLRAWLEQSDAGDEFTRRFDREVVVRNGQVQGAVIAWHDKRLVSAEPPRRWTQALMDPDAGLPLERSLEWSDMVLFDYLLDNTDRWSGGNVLALGEGGKLIFLDNAAGLTRKAITDPDKHVFGGVCRFRASTVASLRTAAPRLAARLEKSSSTDPLAPVVYEGQLAAIETRAERALAHVERCITDHGAEAVLLGEGAR